MPLFTYAFHSSVIFQSVANKQKWMEEGISPPGDALFLEQSSKCPFPVPFPSSCLNLNEMHPTIRFGLKDLQAGVCGAFSQWTPFHCLDLTLFTPFCLFWSDAISCTAVDLHDSSPLRWYLFNSYLAASASHFRWSPYSLRIKDWGISKHLCIINRRIAWAFHCQSLPV